MGKPAIWRLQKWHSRYVTARFSSAMNPKMVEHAPHPGPLPIGSADSADAEREKRSQRRDVGKRQGVQKFKARNASFRRILTAARSRWKREKRSPCFAKTWLDSAREHSYFMKSVNGCAFSPREKVRMRGMPADLAPTATQLLKSSRRFRGLTG